MARKLRVGIVGATVTTGGSGWGANAHVPALQALPDLELVAVCTAHEDTARASAAAFGAPLAFHDIHAMAAHPDVDLVAVSVRVPWHRDLVMSALEAGKPVFCEWPLGANLAEAEEMATYAADRGLLTAVGLQGRSDPTVRHAADLIADGYVGEVLATNLSIVTQAAWERGPGRIWQGQRANGANTLTIAGGHGIDAMCAILGEFAEVTARAVTRVPQWRDIEAARLVDVDAPDVIGVAGRLLSDAEVTVQVSAVPHHPTGSRLEIFGREGMLTLVSRGAFSVGANELFGARGGDALAAIPVPAEYSSVPEGTPAGSPRNVAEAYARIADAWAGGGPFAPDFAHAVTRHRLIDAIERSAATRQAVALT